MKKRKVDGEETVWIRLGDHRREAEALIEKNRREHGGRVVGQPTVLYRQFPTGERTILGATDRWWLAEMGRHVEWGQPLSGPSSFLDAIDAAGQRPVEDPSRPGRP